MKWWATALASIALCACASVALMKPAPLPEFHPERFAWTCFAIFPTFALPRVTPAARVRPDAVALQCFIVDREARLVGVVTVWRMPPKKARPEA